MFLTMAIVKNGDGDDCGDGEGNEDGGGVGDFDVHDTGDCDVDLAGDGRDSGRCVFEKELIHSAW